MDDRWKKTSADYGSFYKPKTHQVAASAELTQIEPFPAQSEASLGLTSNNVSYKSSSTVAAAAKKVTYKDVEEPFSAVYGTEHEGRDTESNVEHVMAGISVEAGADAGEAFDSVYSDAYADKDTASGIAFEAAGVTTTEARAMREGFDAAYGDEYAGADTAGNLGAGMMPEESNGLSFDNVYSQKHAHKDTESSLAFTLGGVVPEEGAAQREGFDAAYGDEHIGKDTHSGIVFGNGGVTTTEARVEREEFDAAYGDEHIGMDTYAPNMS